MTVLRSLFRNLFEDSYRSVSVDTPRKSSGSNGRPTVLNVGGHSKKIPIPEHYSNWNHLVLDIDPRGGADIVCDARELLMQAADQYDAVYCSHNLEHYYHHEVPRVLAGFLHVLKPGGFAEIRVPDLVTVMKKMIQEDLDLENQLYVSPAGPITVRDVIYGSAKLIEQSGNDFMLHKTGFSHKSLGDSLHQAGFREIWIVPGPYEICAFAFKGLATPLQLQQLKLTPTQDA